MNSNNGEKKKRGRKKLKKNDAPLVSEPKVHKKRGRKPKGGKIIQQKTNNNSDKNIVPNIILHLKCSLKDIETDKPFYNLNYDPNVEPIESYNCENSDLQCSVYKDNMDVDTIHDIDKSNQHEQNNETDSNDDDSNDKMKQIWKKINSLKIHLHKNDVSDKRSACFWCTCDFDNPPVFIPKYEIKGSYHVYGCFCNPECAVAYLMNQHIDSAIRFERYHLINYIYGKIYNYEKNIKPAPDPYYLLNKYYGNLTIQEYRKLLQHQSLLLVVEKPLTHILPELHEDNDEFLLNHNVIPNSSYKLKRKTTKSSKKSIVNTTFGSKN